MASALIVEVLRGGEVESRHEVDVVAVAGDGQILWSRGDAERAVLPRSALKPLLAVPLVRTGLLDADPLADRRLALACASHGGEPLHVQSVDDWIADLGLDPDQLECGVHAPTHRPSADALFAAGEPPTPSHNNCSGKHVGFLAVCRHADIESSGYLSPSHPLQEGHLTPIVEELCGVSFADAVPGIDGCGIPVWSQPLDRLAAGWAALARSDEGRRIYAAMAAEPFMVAGTGRACTRLMESGAGRLAVKTGAEGVYGAIALESGAAIALKARDGATRASELAVEWAISELGAGDPPEPHVLRNWAGTVVGDVRIAE